MHASQSALSIRSNIISLTFLPRPFPQQAHLNSLKHSNRAAEIAPIILLRNDWGAVHIDHAGCSLGAKPPDHDIFATADINHVALARFFCIALQGPVIKERVQSSAIDVNVRALKNAETPGLESPVICEGRIVVFLIGLETAPENTGVRLHVGRLGLNEAGVDVLGVGELVIVKLEMF